MRQLLSALTLLASLAGCGVAVESAPRPLDPSSAPYQNLRTPPPALPSGSARALVYLVREGSIVAVTRRVPTLDDESAVLRALVAGPTADERDAGLTSAVPDGTTLHSAAIRSRVAHVEVPTGESAQTGRNDEVMAYAQVVFTLSGLPGVEAVRFVRDGAPLAVPRADGSLTAVPLTRRDYASLL